MMLEERRQYREARAKHWKYELGKLSRVSYGNYLAKKSNPEPILRCEDYDDGEETEYETSTTSSFGMRPKRF